MGFVIDAAVPFVSSHGVGVSVAGFKALGLKFKSAAVLC